MYDMCCLGVKQSKELFRAVDRWQAMWRWMRLGEYYTLVKLAASVTTWSAQGWPKSKTLTGCSWSVVVGEGPLCWSWKSRANPQVSECSIEL